MLFGFPKPKRALNDADYRVVLAWLAQPPLSAGRRTSSAFLSLYHHPSNASRFRNFALRTVSSVASNTAHLTCQDPLATAAADASSGLHPPRRPTPCHPCCPLADAKTEGRGLGFHNAMLVRLNYGLANIMWRLKFAFLLERHNNSVAVDARWRGSAIRQLQDLMLTFVDGTKPFDIRSLTTIRAALRDSGIVPVAPARSPGKGL